MNRACRIPLDRPVPPLTTLVKLVRRAEPKVIEQRKTALLAKLVAVGARKAQSCRYGSTLHAAPTT